ncbi:MAG: hypothetical protein JW904_11725 [Spirochaetales bacterium]|nr:hypothetical protein [Spirochaetales bacterium]
MHRLFSTVIFFLVLLTFLHAQQEVYKPHIAVIPMKNTSNDTQYDSICERVTETIELTLSLLDKYWIERVTTIDPAADLEKAKEFLRLNNYDNAIFGQAIANPADGSIILQCSIYDRRKDAITIKKEVTVANIFSIFNSTEELITSVIENFAGVRIGFGSIQISNTGEKGLYEVYVDDAIAAVQDGTIERVLIGTYKVKVLQMRMKGEYILYEKTIKVNRNAETVIPIEIPYLLPAEEAELKMLEETISTGWADPLKRGAVEGAFAKIAAYLADISFAERLEQKKTEYLRLHDEYKKQFGDIASEMFRVYISVEAGIPISIDDSSFIPVSYFDFGHFYGIELITEWGIFGIGFGFVNLDYSFYDNMMLMHYNEFTMNTPSAELRYTTNFNFFAQLFFSLRSGVSSVPKKSLYVTASIGGMLQFFKVFALELGTGVEYFFFANTDFQSYTYIKTYIGVVFYM